MSSAWRHFGDLSALSLGTFHTSVFAIALLLLIYRGGGLGNALSGLSTLHGFALFGGLWVATVFTTGSALTRHRQAQETGDDPAALAGLATRWAAVNGALFFWWLAFTLWVQQLIGHPTLDTVRVGLTGAAFVLVTTPVALLIGAVIGVVFGLIDSQVIALASRVLRTAGVQRPRL